MCIKCETIHRQTMSLTDLKVHLIVCRRHFHCTRPKIKVYTFVCNNWNRPIDKRNQDVFSDPFFVSSVFGMCCNCNISKNSLRTCSSNCNTITFSFHKISQIVHFSLDFFVVYFYIRKHRLRSRRSIHHIRRLIDFFLFVEIGKRFSYRTTKSL